ALSPSRLHSGEHLRSDRNEANSVSLQRQSRFPSALAENDGGLAFEQVVAVLVDGDVREDEPLRWRDLAKFAFHRIIVPIRPMHHDAQAAAHAGVERFDGTGETTRPEPL